MKSEVRSSVMLSCKSNWQRAAPAIKLNEINPKDIMHVRAELVENRRLVEAVKAALRQAKPSGKEEGLGVATATSNRTGS